jgi:hypothetical protein
VGAAGLGVEALTHDLAVLDDHRSDQGIRARPPAAALGELDRPGEVRVVDGLERAHGVQSRKR